VPFSQKTVARYLAILQDSTDIKAGPGVGVADMAENEVAGTTKDEATELYMPEWDGQETRELVDGSTARKS
jgi:hypothetical protein